jgi:hypothetical protein
MNEDANHEHRCINELKINNALPEDANHAKGADAPTVANGVPGRGEPTAKQFVNQPRERYLIEKFPTTGDSKPLARETSASRN